MYEPLIKEACGKAEQILATIKKYEGSIVDYRKELDITIAMLIKGEANKAKPDGVLTQVTGFRLTESIRQHNKEKLGNDLFSPQDTARLSTDPKFVTAALLSILTTLAGVQHVNDEAIKKERLEKQLIIMKQNYARDNENTVFAIFKDVDNLTTEARVLFKKICSIIVPANYIQRRKQIREAFDTLTKAYLELVNFRASVKKTFEMLQDYIEKGKRPLPGYSKQDFYSEVYEYCDVQNLVSRGSPYYKRGIKEGILYFVNIPDVITVDKKWAGLRSELRRLYSKEYYKTLISPGKRKAWRKYNAAYLDTLSYIHGRLNAQLKFILFITMIINIAVIGTLYPSIPQKIQSWYFLNIFSSNSKSATDGQNQADDIVQLAETARRSDTVQNWNRLASALFEKERFSEAIDAYQRVLRLEPQSVSATIEIGICHLKVGEYGKAIDCFKKAREINPWNVQSYYNAGIAYDIGFKRVDLAIVEYEKAIEIDPKYIPARINLITCFRTVKKTNAALELAKKSLEIDPSDPKLHYMLGQIMLWDLNRGEEALREYKKTLELDPNYAQAYVQIGNYYDRQKKYPRALEQYQKAVSINPNGADAYVQMGICYENMGKYTLSLDQHRKAISLESQNVAAHVHMGYCYEMLSNYQSALDQYRRAITINPNDAQARYYAGMFLAYKMKRISDGANELEMYLALEPDAPNADDVRQKIKSFKGQRM